jgi:hypothetical protein
VRQIGEARQILGNCIHAHPIDQREMEGMSFRELIEIGDGVCAAIDGDTPAVQESPLGDGAVGFGGARESGACEE